MGLYAELVAGSKALDGQINGHVAGVYQHTTISNDLNLGKGDCLAHCWNASTADTPDDLKTWAYANYYPDHAKPQRSWKSSVGR